MGFQRRVCTKKGEDRCFTREAWGDCCLGSVDYLKKGKTIADAYFVSIFNEPSTSWRFITFSSYSIFFNSLSLFLLSNFFLVFLLLRCQTSICPEPYRLFISYFLCYCLCNSHFSMTPICFPFYSIHFCWPSQELHFGGLFLI